MNMNEQYFRLLNSEIGNDLNRYTSEDSETFLFSSP